MTLRCGYQPCVLVQEDSRSAYRTVNLKNAALSAAALKAVLAFMYTERLDVAIEEVDAVLRVARKCRMHAVVKAIGEEMRTLKYYFKSTRRDEAPRRSQLLSMSAGGIFREIFAATLAT